MFLSKAACISEYLKSTGCNDISCVCTDEAATALSPCVLSDCPDEVTQLLETRNELCRSGEASPATDEATETTTSVAIETATETTEEATETAIEETTEMETPEGTTVETPIGGNQTAISTPSPTADDSDTDSEEDPDIVPDSAAAKGSIVGLFVLVAGLLATL